MKKKIVVIGLMALSIIGFAQSPEKMSYQAVIRDGSSNLVSSSAVGIRISILQGSISGNSVYTETHTTNTNVNGLASLEIGAGNVTSGNFSSIDWGAGPYFIKTETDPSGGTNYSITATSQLLSVPYALHAQSAGNVNNVETLTVNGFGETTIELTDGTTLTDGIGGFLTLTDTIATRLMIENTGIADNAPDYDAWMKFRFPSVAEWSVGMDASDNAFKIDNTGSIGASPEFSILQNGFTGIGTNNPVSLLNISGSISNPAELTIEAPASSAFHHGAIVFKARGLTNKRGLGLFMLDTLGNNEWFVGRPYGSFSGGNSDQFVIQRLVTSSHSQAASGIANGSEVPTGTVRLLTLTNNGSLGLGTTTPARTLHVKDVMRLEPRNSAPASPVQGDIYYDSGINRLRVFDGTTWQNCW